MPRSASASGFYKLLESSAAGNQHWSCPKTANADLAKSLAAVQWNLEVEVYYPFANSSTHYVIMLYCFTECTIVFPCYLGCKTFPQDSRNGKEESNLVFVLIDEVESLAMARKAAISGSEPSDSIRVVNALLTQMDKLKSSPNVIILTTSNITTAIGKPKSNFHSFNY
ncbi:hypothetical protein Ahy_B10g103160 [Arachis hypogaea]|uniref:Pachytene checkpoint protein 2 homolog n=1 Tax=Arachis hypogaea TaxID=3818 RepID=A0A444X3F0_ARAHY|nr:hypothetical protein Ahy_B10g103160 [Arachis hypogaea]